MIRQTLALLLLAVSGWAYGQPTPLVAGNSQEWNNEQTISQYMSEFGKSQKLGARTNKVTGAPLQLPAMPLPTLSPRPKLHRIPVPRAITVSQPEAINLGSLGSIGQADWRYVTVWTLQNRAYVSVRQGVGIQYCVLESPYVRGKVPNTQASAVLKVIGTTNIEGKDLPVLSYPEDADLVSYLDRYVDNQRKLIATLSSHSSAEVEKYLDEVESNCKTYRSRLAEWEKSNQENKLEYDKKLKKYEANYYHHLLASNAPPYQRIWTSKAGTSHCAAYYGVASDRKSVRLIDYSLNVKSVPIAQLSEADQSHIQTLRTYERQAYEYFRAYKKHYKRIESVPNLLTNWTINTNNRSTIRNQQRKDYELLLDYYRLKADN